MMHGIPNSGSVTGKDKLTTEQFNKLLKAVIKSLDKSMTKDGSIIKQRQNADKQVKNSSDKSSLPSVKDVADAMKLLNKTFGSNIGISQSNFTPAISSAAPSAASGFSQGVRNAASYSSPAGFQRLNNLSANIDSFDAEELNDVIANDIDPMVSTAQSNLTAAKADYKVLLGQKEGAQANIASLQDGIKAASAQKSDAKKSFDTNKSHLDSSVKARDKMDEQLSALNSEYDSICSDVKEKEAAKSKCQGRVSECKTNVSGAETGLNNATAAYESAQKALDNTPQTLPDGSPNPAYPAAKTACDKALAAKEQAQKALDSAKKELENAQKELDTANENLTAAQNIKNNKLNDIKKTDSECAKLVETCQRNQQQVENAQKSYDTSLEQLDTVNNNYEKLEMELQSAQGILTQCDEYENKIKDLQEAADNAAAIKEKAQKALETKDSKLAGEVSNEADRAKREEIKKEISANAYKSEGCSAAKTPAENLLSMKNGPYGMNELSRTAEFIDTPMGRMQTASSAGVVLHANVMHKDKSYFDEIGCIANADGSYTNPENGETYVNVKDNVWVNTMYFGQMDAEYANAVDPEVRKAGIRAKEQGKTWELVKLDKNTGRAILR